jgi:glucosamine--fructose-6-phosphate aminotransferase (isomerizing)
MCGIVACITEKDVAPLLLQGLKRIEYRGYDSAGIAAIQRGRISVRKDIGRIAEIEKQDVFSLEGSIGLGHTRWATHGGVTRENAHPHTSCNERIAIVHNGIITNYLALKRELERRGHIFKSETDSEIIAHLIEQEYEMSNDNVKAIIKTARKLRGQYSFVVLFSDREGVLTGARNDAPLLIGLSDRKKFFASDVLAFIEHTDRVIFLDNLEVAELSSDGVRIFDLNGKKVKKEVTHVAWELADISKLDYAHYTLKEIYEQPISIQSAVAQDEERLSHFEEVIRNADSVLLTGAGSSYHAALILKYLLNRNARIRADAILAGEFEHQSHLIDSGTVLIALSQSGETADVLDAVKLSRKQSARILSIVNAAGSSLARESDITLLLNCGPEVGVAATKSFTAQLMISNIVVDRLTGKNGIKDQSDLSTLIKSTLKVEEFVKKIAGTHKINSDFYFVARGIHYPIALEGALKLKELSYIHAEGMPASELKHGTLALIEQGTPIVILNPSDGTYDDILSNAQELKARGADLIGVSNRPSRLYAHNIVIPAAKENILPILEVIPLQLLAYYMAIEKKNDPDYPRNLAKSVTVK